jgi:hypothetical protein
MSTLAYLRFKVDMRLRQMDTKNRTYSVPEVDQAIREKYIAKKTMLPPAHVAESSAFTISAGADTFTPTLAGTTYSDALDVRLQLVSNGLFLVPSTVEEIDALRYGQPTLLLGIPYWFALWEDHQGVARGRCYPGAKDAQAVNMYRSRSHAAITSATDLDSAAVYFNEASCNALAQAVAADLLIAMPDDEVKKRGLTRDIAPAWAREADKLFYQEEARKNDLIAAGRTQRWVC